MSNGAYLRIAGQPREKFREHVQVYARNSFLTQEIFRGCRLGRLGEGEVRLLDAMSGPGRLGTDLLNTAREKGARANIRISFLDINQIPLEGLSKEGFETIQSDVRELHTQDSLFDIIAIRHGLKSLAKGELANALKSLRESLLPGGRIVIGDMTAFTEKSQAGIIQVHSAKQEFAGRDIQAEGLCFIPTFEEWQKEIKGAGLQVKSMATGWSEIKTSQWAGQFGPDANDQEIIGRMNEIIEWTARDNPKFAKEIHVTFEGGIVKLDFPVVVVEAERI